MRKSSYKTPERAREAENLLKACKVLGSHARMNILTLLIRVRNGRKEICVTEIAKATSMSQSAASHQLALLEAHGIIAGTRRGQTRCYLLTNTRLTKDIEKIIRVINPAL